MKNIFKKSSLLVASFFLLVSCSDYLDINEDPNNPTNVKPELLLANAQNSGAKKLNVNMNQVGNFMAYNWANNIEEFIAYQDEMQYTMNSTFYDDVWDDLYLTLVNFHQIEKTTLEDYENYQGIAKIMKAFYFQYLVDLYGDIPYSEALQRDLELSPAYDDAEVVYDDLIVQLDAAIDLIKNAPASALNPGNNDIMLHGDMDEWVKFANTLKMRILIRQSGMASKQAYIAEKFDDIINEGSGFITENVISNPGYLVSTGKMNPFFETFGTTLSGSPTDDNNSLKGTRYTVDYLTNTNDTRLEKIYASIPGGGFAGINQGAPDEQGTVVVPYSGLGNGILKNFTQDAYILTAAESYLLQAEAVARGYIAGSAQSLYESGIEASYVTLGLTSAEASTYYSQTTNLVGWAASSGNEIEAIITQKWIALNSINGAESWIEYTRTGFPSSLPISLIASRPQRPIRLMYPNSEYVANSANVPNQTTDDAFTSPIFWDN
ncbi:SusD/RagB family nutrient-binding outer membrane lipoprotein [Flavobacterium microcysteis]